jgi:AraC-like DNA-binding protein
LLIFTQNHYKNSTGIGADMQQFYQNRIEPFKSYELSNHVLSPYFHNQLEVIYIISGSCCMTIDDNSYLLKCNDAAIVFPYQIHNLDQTKNCHFLVETFSPEYASEYIPFLNGYIPSVPVLENIKKDFSDALKKAHKYHAQKNNSQIARAYVSVFMSFLFQEITLIPSKTLETHNILYELLTYIDSHFTEHLSLDVLSKKLHITKFYISRIFSKQLHTTFPHYINHLRLNYAQDLLQNSNFSISQIAYECGFESERTFFRVFHESVHLSPLQYQKALKLQKLN